VPDWSDPAFPTLQGFYRKGLTVEAIRQFILSQGHAKTVLLMDVDKLWATNKAIIEPIVPRYIAIPKARQILCHFTNGPATPYGQSHAKHKKKC